MPLPDQNLPAPSRVRLIKSGAVAVSIGLTTKQTLDTLSGAADVAGGSTGHLAAKAAERVGMLFGPRIGKTAGETAGMIFGSTIVVGGKVIPLVAVSIITAAAVWRVSKHLRKKQWRLAAAECGVSAVEVGINVSLINVPAVGLVVGEAFRQSAVEVLRRKAGLKIENSGIYELYKLARHGLRHVQQKKAEAKAASAPAHSLARRRFKRILKPFLPA